METFATDREKLDFLLETDADLALAGLEADAAGTAEAAQAESEERPKYVATYIGSKQKLVDWIWRNTPEGVKRAFHAFCGSAVVGYMFKTKALRVVANDRLRSAFHTARALPHELARRHAGQCLGQVLHEDAGHRGGRVVAPAMQQGV